MISRSIPVLWITCALMVGFSAGSVFERRGWTPNFYDLDSMQAEAVIARSRPLTGDTLLTVGARQDLVIGTAGPLVTVYTNFECPFCARFDSTVHELAAKGKYRFNHRYLVYSFQQSAYRKHRLIECSRLAGLPLNPIFREAFNWPKSIDWPISAVMDSVDARSIEHLEACVVGEGDLADHVSELLQADSMAARMAGIVGTPSWVIGDRMGAGVLSEKAFEEVYKALALSSGGR